MKKRKQLVKNKELELDSIEIMKLIGKRIEGYREGIRKYLRYKDELPIEIISNIALNLNMVEDMVVNYAREWSRTKWLKNYLRWNESRKLALILAICISGPEELEKYEDVFWYIHEKKYEYEIDKKARIERLSL